MSFKIIAILVFTILFWRLLKYRRRKLREKIKNNFFKPQWEIVLEKNFTLYHKLPDDLKTKLHGLINLFINEKIFSGYNGLVITDEIKVTISAQACLLQLNKGDALYPYLKNIFVYPDAFKSMQTTSDGVVKTTKEVVRVGESWQLGHIVLSWKHSKIGAMNDSDGQNVVYHEFAHQLDQEDGAIDGTPLLNLAEDYESWSEIFSKEYSELKSKISKNKKTLIDSYGAVSEGEFFAVVTELFFEKPKLFHQEHTDLYCELKKFYKLDPRQWL